MAKRQQNTATHVERSSNDDRWRPPPGQTEPAAVRTALPAPRSDAKWMSPTAQLAAISDGLGGRTGDPKRVIIAGAGIAGLAAADLLERAGHHVLLLEGQHRVGGRIYTVRDGLAPGLFAEMGAMRIPLNHALTMAYVDRFGLHTAPFTMDNPKTWIYLQGSRTRREDFDPADQRFDFHLGSQEKRLLPHELLSQTLKPLLSSVKRARNKAKAWEEIVQKHDHFSLGSFLKDSGWSDGAIEMLGLLANVESRMNSSFVEFLHHEYDSTFSDMVYIKDGLDALPNAFLRTLINNIRFGAVLEEIWQFPSTVTAFYRTDGTLHRVEADYLIVTIPFSLMRHIRVRPPLTPRKARAIRQVNYDAASKVFMQFSRRFWEDDDGIYGGGTITDASIRNVFYPEHGRETGRGVLLASYTWGRDSTYLATLPRPYLIQLTLEHLADIHPDIERYYEGSLVHHWGLDPFAGGVGVLFEPNQTSNLFDDIVSPEDRIYFAGDHCSRFEKRWIQGALESALQTARDVHNAKP